MDRLRIPKPPPPQEVTALPLTTPVSSGNVRFVCISDTHSRTQKLEIPPGDILIHAGDFSNEGRISEVANFNKFLASLPHTRKIVIAGNHELSFDPETNMISYDQMLKELHGKDNIRDLLTDCTYLEDSATDVFGYKIYGSPWQPEFMGWAYNLPRGKALREKWDMIPTDTDILITHGPPYGHGDVTRGRNNVGCEELLKTIQLRVKPLYHIFGHIHEGYGITTDGTTNYINASTCTIMYKPLNPPIIFDLPLKDGVTKEKH
ncbi:metallophosphoesterase domain-containing protein 1-like [Tubulanus polymorphus]|uniref:metallophosphoesterase domain-containing protein 1-like n=1 Tax=Tubulanus polymorphus TaxID=672921 RepID=UPI003DA59B48